MPPLLTGLMILLFLGIWRSTVVIIVCHSAGDPVLDRAAFGAGPDPQYHDSGRSGAGGGHSGGRRHRHHRKHQLASGEGQAGAPGHLDGAQQIVMPAFVSLLCICIAFVPMFFLPGVSGFLFAPMAEAVVFALIGSFILSRTLVPTLANYLLVAHGDAQGRQMWRAAMTPAEGHHPKNLLALVQHGFEQRFEKIRGAYHGYLTLAMAIASIFAGGFLAFVLLSLLLVPFLGRNFFPRGGCGRNLSACPRARRHPHRGNRGAVRSRREPHPSGHPARPAGLDRRQYRPAGQRHRHAPISIPAPSVRRTATSWSP